jgi:uncharacterized protein YjiS (DUF1127 family)
MQPHRRIRNQKEKAMSTHALPHGRSARIALPRPSARSLAALLGLARTRAALRSLDDRMLRDIGVSRAQADSEAARPVWDVPAGWRR